MKTNAESHLDQVSEQILHCRPHHRLSASKPPGTDSAPCGPHCWRASLPQPSGPEAGELASAAAAAVDSAVDPAAEAPGTAEPMEGVTEEGRSGSHTPPLERSAAGSAQAESTAAVGTGPAEAQMQPSHAAAELSGGGAQRICCELSVPSFSLALF
jgi:hypothetical protein